MSIEMNQAGCEQFAPFFRNRLLLTPISSIVGQRGEIHILTFLHSVIKDLIEWFILEYIGLILLSKPVILKDVQDTVIQMRLLGELVVQIRCSECPFLAQGGSLGDSEG